MIISSIVARDRNGGIGLDNKLLIHLPKDLAWFRKQTIGKVVVMGSKTHLSIGKFLEKRVNVVLTRNKDFVPLDKDVIVFHNIHEMLNYFKDEKEIMVIGGGEIYRQFAPMVNRHYVTEIDALFGADTFYPPFDTKVYKRFFNKGETREVHEHNGIKYEFAIYKKVD
ncbi:dihydrofolate reductase [Bacillus phage DIGNKC]|uniref:dihydrofolate reductase n=1 Tax=Bacillus phage DIGNKC TaxID=1805948 RepID=UPI0007A7732C|nr:dihydrofolate reductase [Bacillus phage DIGNKC]AMW62736.1 dihydrofolate reductase [Bacillus phage DIGNKC]